MRAFFRFLAGLAGLAGLARLLRGHREPAGGLVRGQAGTPGCLEDAGDPTAVRAAPAQGERPPAGDPAASARAPSAVDADDISFQADATPFDDGEDPAEELKRRLAAVRASESAAPTAPVPTAAPPRPEPAAAPAQPESHDALEPDLVAERMPLEERRALIHARAHEAIDAMKALEG